MYLTDHENAINKDECNFGIGKQPTLRAHSMFYIETNVRIHQINRVI